MKRIFILRKSSVLLAVVILLVLAGGGLYYSSAWYAASTSASERPKKEFTVITTEYKSKTAEGKILEVYRWDPGTIVVNEGDEVTLRFLGVNGNFHPFVIKGLGVKGEVKKGRETTVTFVADKEGTYEIVCTVHSDFSLNGPMVGYLVVD